MARTEVRSAQIKDETLTSDDIGSAAVRGADANGGNQREIALGTVSDVDLRDDAVTAPKLDDTGDFSAGSLSVGDGTAASPSLSFKNSANAGVFLSATNQVSVSTSSTEALRIDSSQDVDFLQHEAKQLVVHILTSDPISPVEGQIYYNSTDKQWKGYNGTNWVLLG